MLRLRFYKTQLFKKRAAELDAWKDVDELKLVLDLDPFAGDVIPGGAGLRKVRMPLASRGKGKRGGARVIYYQVADKRYILLVYLYAKNEVENLEDDELKVLGRIRDATVEQISKERNHEKKFGEGT